MNTYFCIVLSFMCFGGLLAGCAVRPIRAVQVQSASGVIHANCA